VNRHIRILFVVILGTVLGCSKRSEPAAQKVATKVEAAPTEGTLIVKVTNRALLLPDYRVYIDEGVNMGGEVFPANVDLLVVGDNLVGGTEPASSLIVAVKKGGEWELVRRPTPTVKEYQFTLRPGKHEVDIGIFNHLLGGYPERPAYSFLTAVAKVEAGGTTVVEFDGTGRVYRGRDVQLPGSYRVLRDRVERGEIRDIGYPANYEDNLRQALAQLRGVRPAKPFVVFDMPDEGTHRAHEYDADQVERVGEWMLAHGNITFGQPPIYLGLTPEDRAAKKAEEAAQRWCDGLRFMYLSDSGRREKVAQLVRDVVAEMRRISKEG
jgi:hypothetical protein